MDWSQRGKIWRPGGNFLEGNCFSHFRVPLSTMLTVSRKQSCMPIGMSRLLEHLRLQTPEFSEPAFFCARSWIRAHRGLLASATVLSPRTDFFRRLRRISRHAHVLLCWTQICTLTRRNGQGPEVACSLQRLPFLFCVCKGAAASASFPCYPMRLKEG